MNMDRLAFISLFSAMTGAGWCPPLLLTGLPGRAKTAKAAGWARKYRLRFLHLSPGQKGDGYFGVVPVPVTTKSGDTILTFPSNKDIHAMMEQGRGLILLDEVRSAPGIIRPALLGTLQERMFGDARLPPGVRIIGASNATKDATNGRPLSPPEANRLCHVSWHGFDAIQMRSYFESSSKEHPFADRIEPDYNDWSEFEEIESKILAKREVLRVAAAQQVFTFVSRVPSVDRNGKHVGDAIHRMPAPGTEACDGPWPSERSWSNLVEVLWSYRAMKAEKILDNCPQDEKDDPELQALLRGFVGPIAGELLEWISEQDLPDYAAWLDGHEKVKFEKGRDDRAYLIFAGAGAFIVNHPRDSEDQRTKRRRRVSAFFEYAIQNVPIVGFETVMAGVKLIQDNALATGVRDDLMVKPAHDFMVAYRKETADIAAGIA